MSPVEPLHMTDIEKVPVHATVSSSLELRFRLDFTEIEDLNFSSSRNRELNHDNTFQDAAYVLPYAYMLMLLPYACVIKRQVTSGFAL